MGGGAAGGGVGRGGGGDVGGGVAFTKLPLATKTQVELPRLTVSATWFGSAPELVETYLTSPLEEAIQSVRGSRRSRANRAMDRRGWKWSWSRRPM